MMPEASRRTIALDPDDAVLPEGLLLPPERGGEVVALLIEPDHQDWGTRAALAIARGWSERGRQVVLVDADVARPRLGAKLGLPEGEGTSDALLFGASPERIRVRGEGLSFDVVRTGTVVPDPGQLWGHDSWPTVLQALRGDDGVVVLLLPEGREGTASLVARADRTFRMGTTSPAGEDEPTLIHPGAAKASAGAPAEVSKPAAPAPAPDDAVGSGAVSGMTRPDQDTLAARKPAAPAQRGAAPAGGAPAARVSSTRPVGKRRLPLLLLVLLVLVLALLGALWFEWIEIPGIALPPRSAADLLLRLPLG
jgi:hypothetical protein